MSLTTISIRLLAASALLMLTACSGRNQFAAPTGLSATLAATQNSVNLSWNPSASVIGYNVYRGTASGAISTKTLIASNISANSYTDLTVTFKTDYYYQVTAIDSAGESSPSTEVSIKIPSEIGGAIQGVALSLEGGVTTVAGAATPGFANYTGSAARFNNPHCVTTDGKNLYIADTSNNAIRQVVIASGAVTTLAGSGNAGLADGTGSAASFNGPAGITTDGANIYVADTGNNAVRQINISTGAVTTLAGSSVPGSSNGIGAAAGFNQPAGISTDGNYVYLSDTGNNMIRQIGIATGAVTTLAGSGTSGNTDGTGAAALFSAPRGLVVVGAYLYVADTGNNIIRSILITSGAVTTFAGSGTAGSANGIGTEATFSSPAGITTDGVNLYVADTGNNLIRSMDASATVTTLAGNDKAGFTNGIGKAATFSAPDGITTDGTKLFVTDSANNCIRGID